MNLLAIPGRYRLLYGLQRYLIIFAPHTLVLDQWRCSCQTPSHLLVYKRSSNFTSHSHILMAPVTPINHYFAPQTNRRGKIIFHYPMLKHSMVASTYFERVDLFTVIVHKHMKSKLNYPTLHCKVLTPHTAVHSS